MAAPDTGYDPFARGPHSVAVRTVQAHDRTRDRVFTCEIWHPEEPGTWPLILYSHHSGGSRVAATFLTTHLCSHGYVVAALDHSETFAPDLARKEVETPEQKAARAQAWAANRVPDLLFLLERMLASESGIDVSQIALVGHSFGGWTVLETAADRRIGAVVALAPGGASNPRPGILALTLAFQWGRDVPTLYLVAENDTPLPLSVMHEIYERTPASKQMVVLRRADHLHFIDDVEELHEKFRKTPFSPELAWLQRETLPIGELCSGEQAHLFIRGLTVCHMDAVLKQKKEARSFLAGDVARELAARGVDAFVHRPD